MPFELPDKKILVFNHRWAKTTGVEKLVSYTKDLDEDWLVWITDRNARKPKAGKPAPEAFKDHKCGLRIEGLERSQYRYLIENCLLRYVCRQIHDLEFICPRWYTFGDTNYSL